MAHSVILSRLVISEGKNLEGGAEVPMAGSVIFKTSTLRQQDSREPLPLARRRQPPVERRLRLAGPWPFTNSRIAQAAAGSVAEMDFVIRIQDSPRIPVLSVYDFAAQALCPHMGPHILFGREQFADPAFSGRRIKKVGHLSLFPGRQDLLTRFRILAPPAALMTQDRFDRDRSISAKSFLRRSRDRTNTDPTTPRAANVSLPVGRTNNTKTPREAQKRFEAGAHERIEYAGRLVSGEELYLQQRRANSRPLFPTFPTPLSTGQS